MQSLVWIIPLVIILAVITIDILKRKFNKKLRRKIDREFGRVPEHKEFDINSVNGYHFYALRENNTDCHIDNTTWDDLNMDDIYKRIDNCQSSIGQEYLYHKLHEVCFDEEKRNDYNNLVELFSDESRRKEGQLLLAKLGKSNHSISSLAFNPKQYKLKLPSFVYTLMTILVVLLIITTIVCISLSIKIASLFLILSFINIVVNIVLYYITKFKLENQLSILNFFASALWTCKKIIKSQFDYKGDYFSKLNHEYSKLSFIRSRMSRWTKSAISEVDYLKEFIYMIFLIDIRKYNKSIKMIVKNRDAVKHIYKCIGEIDVSINTHSLIKSLKHSCRPSFCTENKIDFEEVYHPLLKEPISNSGTLDRNIIITGANASGKSTFIKAIAINNILALSLNVCCAKRYSLKRSLTITSMAQRDDILAGESYYIAELKSLKRILGKIDEFPCSCFVDEILKGTNTVERIAASISVLEYLLQKNCLCLIATHDTEIAETLDGDYLNFHFEEKITDENIEFDYILKKGIATSRNAVKLLGFFDYPQKIVNSANTKVDEFEDTKSWSKRKD